MEKNEEDCAGEEGHGEKGGSRKEKKETEKMDGGNIRVEEIMGGERKKEIEKREDRG